MEADTLEYTYTKYSSSSLRSAVQKYRQLFQDGGRGGSIRKFDVAEARIERTKDSNLWTYLPSLKVSPPSQIIAER